MNSFITPPPYNSNQNFGILIWLVCCALLIYAMIVLGGVTRLTHSGLSMVNWEPLMGIFPPLNSSDWRELFLQYQQYPEYKMVNSAISLEEFKGIFYFEYFHRVLGRLIGVAFFIPLVIFWANGKLTTLVLKKLSVIFLLGAAQGILGWYMVKSGLIDEPRVSQYRLTAHLGLAVALYGAIIWLAADIVINKRFANTKVTRPNNSAYLFALALPFLIYLMILSGGFVAGLRAGLIWNTFPLMGESFIPPGLYAMSPAWLSMFEDMTTVQFNHRMLGYFIFLIATTMFVLFLKSDSTRAIMRLMLVLYLTVCCQIALGVTTLLQGVPVVTASLHQACAVLVFTAALLLAKSVILSQRQRVY